MSEAKIEAYFFTTLFIVVLIVIGILFYPFFGAIAVALVLATLSHPVYAFILHKVHNPAVAAFLVVLLVTLAILLPAMGLLVLLVDEVRSVTTALSALHVDAMPTFFEGMKDKLLSIAPFLSIVDLPAVMQTLFEQVGAHAGEFVAGAADVILKMLVSIIALYYLLKDGRAFLYGFIQLSPLSDEEDVQIIHKLKEVSYSLIRGTLVIAVLQGLMTGLGFLMFGVPNPVLWGALAAVGALLPMVGTGIVAVPAVLYLAVAGHYAAAIGLAAWSMLIVGLVDNVIGPKLIGSGARIHPLFVLLSVLGGLILFGMAGFLIGPLLFGLLIALWEIYKVKIKEMHQRAMGLPHE